MQLIPRCSWKPSKLTKRQIQSLESEGFLQKHLIGWRCALGHESPFEETEELTVFKSFFECGFGIPTSDFFRGILNFYQIELCHLSISMIGRQAMELFESTGSETDGLDNSLTKVPQGTSALEDPILDSTSAATLFSRST